MIGRTLSHYQIVGEISRGGMGVVYRATDVHLGREVALKVLPEDLVHDPERRERLLHEARAASALEHPHVAVIHEVGEADGVTFIAMELIRGEKLSDLLARGPLRPTRTLELAVETAEGLARAHDRAAALDPQSFQPALGRRAVGLQRHDWNGVEAISARLAGSPTPFRRYQAHIGRFQAAGARGRFADLQAAGEKAADEPGLAHAKARDQYRRFVDLWGDGDMERGWAGDAKARLARL